MKCNYLLNEEDRLSGLSLGVYNQDALVIDIPNDFDMAHMQDYKVENGQLVYDPLPPVAFYDTAADTDNLLLELAEAVTLLELGVK